MSVERLRPSRLPLADVVELALLGMRARRVRAALSTLGVAIGMATLVLVVAIPSASRAALLAQLQVLGSNLVEAQAAVQPGLAVSFPGDAAAMVRRIGPVTAAVQLGNVDVPVRRSGLIPPATTVGLSVLATGADLLDVVGDRLAAGRFLTASNERFPVAVLGYQAAASLGITRPAAPGRPSRVLLGRRWFTVVGIAGPMPVTSNLDWGVFVGWDAARSALGFDGRASVVYARAPASQLGPVEGVLGPTLFPAVPGFVDISQPSDALAASRAARATTSGLLVGLAAVSLLVGGIGIANTMFVAVLERRHEIGLRRALGATRGQIRIQFLAESVVLSAAGGLTGAGVGGLAAVAYALAQGWPPTLPLPAAATSVLGAVAVGAVAGLHPAARAARLAPTDALASA